MMTTRPLTMRDYLDMKAVSAGLLCEVEDTCPARAWWGSPWNPQRPANDDTDASDAGTIAHAILLENSEACCTVIDPAEHRSKPTKDNPEGSIPAGWTNNAIRAARDAAREAGKIPVLAGGMAEIRAMVKSARSFIDSLRDDEPAIYDIFQPGGGESESTLLWDEGFDCKARPDRMATDHRVIVDLKFTDRIAEPDSWGRTQLSGMGYYRSAACYRRGVRALYSVDCDYIFLVVETAPPYLCSLVGVDPPAMDLGERENAHALAIWRECVKRNHWPGYPRRVSYPSLPVYKEMAFAEREGEDLDALWTKGLGSQP